MGTSLVVQWSGICLPMQETQVWSLVGELRSHMLEKTACCNKDPVQPKKKKKIKTVKTGIFLTCTKRCVVFGLLRCGKEPACQCRRHKRCGFDLWVGKIPWRRAWQPTAVFLPGESHGQRSLGLQSMGSQRVGHNRGTEQILNQATVSA